MILDRKYYFISLFIILILYIIFFYTNPSTTSSKYQNIINGSTMGTTYSIEIIDSTLNDTDILFLEEIIDSILLDVNNLFSTYIDSSEINKVNNSTQIKFSSTFTDLYNKAVKYCKLSHGRYDITVSPLIALWGFSDYNYTDFPSYSGIKETLVYVGYSKITEISPKYKAGKPIQLEIKKDINTKIDLNSIAKGYAVDMIYDYLNNSKYDLKNYLIEIGGELRSKNNSDKNWTIGIQNPQENSIIHKINLSNYSLATSGTYNNYFEKDGTKYSHIINPITGYPIEQNIVSATVIAPNCVDADALATLLMVIDWKEGITIINNLVNTECFIILKDRDNILLNRYSDGFLGFIVD